MVNISKKYLDARLKNQVWKNLLADIQESKEITEILKKILTAKEIIMLEKRLAILEMLRRGESYRTIRHDLDVSPATISFVKNGFIKNKRNTRLTYKSNFIFKKTRGRKKFPRYKGTRGFGLAEW